jgi:hypothetical protein
VLLFAVSILVLPLSVSGQAEDPPKPGKVAIAGTGGEPDWQNVVEGLTEYLESVGVPVKQIDASGKTARLLTEQLAPIDADSLLYITVKLGTGSIRDKGTLACYDPSGKQLWAEEITGGIFRASGERAIKDMTNKMKKRLAKRLGGPGLPQAGK